MAKNKIPPMGGMNMNAMLRQAQKMQADMENARRELDEKEYSFASGGGEVQVEVLDGDRVLASARAQCQGSATLTLPGAQTAPGRALGAGHSTG